MHETRAPAASWGSRIAPRLRIGAVIAIALAAGIVTWLVMRDTSDSSPEPTSVSAAQLQALAASVGHPVFWLGPRKGFTYELRQEENGSIFVRYLPAGVGVGANGPYLTVATYAFPGALGALQIVAGNNSRNAFDLPGGGLAVPAKGYPQSIHIAYPRLDYQVEVFHPTPGRARQLVAAGELANFGRLSKAAPVPAAPRAEAASPQDLRALAREVGHPVYWIGRAPSTTYEVTHSPSGKIFIRYLPKGVEVGVGKPYLTVATYPFPGAFGAIQALANQKDAVAIQLARGGLAVVDGSSRQSIHLAFPESDYQVEIFDPSPARVLRLVTAGRVRSID